MRSTTWLLAASLTLAGVVALVAAVRGERDLALPMTTVVVLLVLVLSSTWRRDPGVSARAAAQWSPERVREVVASAGAEHDRVAATRALRDADGRLGLADAAHLADTAAR